MKEKPILFSTPMVKAILEGRKTQTRRIIKPQPSGGWAIPPLGIIDGNYSSHGCRSDVKCPWQVGQELWVRETWADLYPESKPHKKIIAYRAEGGKEDGSIKWKPSIFMPRKASRIQLRIKDIRVERVQDISVEDCLKEGIEPSISGMNIVYAFHDLWDSINANRKDKDGNILPYSWEHNPFVWVIEFEKKYL